MPVHIPEDMDVPSSRRDTTQPENVRWLIRNLPFRNAGHPHFKKTWMELRKESRKHGSR